MQKVVVSQFQKDKVIARMAENEAEKLVTLLLAQGIGLEQARVLEVSQGRCLPSQPPSSPGRLWLRGPGPGLRPTLPQCCRRGQEEGQH